MTRKLAAWACLFGAFVWTAYLGLVAVAEMVK